MKYIVHTYYEDFEFENGNFAMSFAEQMKSNAVDRDFEVSIRFVVEPTPDPEESEVTE